MRERTQRPGDDGRVAGVEAVRGRERRHEGFGWGRGLGVFVCGEVGGGEGDAGDEEGTLFPLEEHGGVEVGRGGSVGGGCRALGEVREVVEGHVVGGCGRVGGSSGGGRGLKSGREAHRVFGEALDFCLAAAVDVIHGVDHRVTAS